MVRDNFDLRLAKSLNEIVDCLEEGTYGDSPKVLIEFFESLPHNQEMDFLRIMTVPFLFHHFEKNVKSNSDPIAWFSQVLHELKDRVEKLVSAGNFSWLLERAFESTPEDQFGKEIKQHTGQHYGTLFKAFDARSYFEEAKKLLQDRLERNGVNLGDISKSRLLDQGCGGGRYTTAWKLMGTGHCTGLDFSELGLNDARLRVESAGLDNIEFIQGSVLEMPFEDETFDILYSNGVLHHTEDWKKGISEQLRVMKPGAWGWQYLIEKPGGIFWDKIEILRAILRNVPKPFAQQVMKGLGVPSNRVFYMLDHVMVPINTRIAPEHLFSELEKYGAVEIRRLTRGTDFDRIESIYQGVPYAKEKFGAGENRYVFRKNS